LIPNTLVYEVRLCLAVRFTVKNYRNLDVSLAIIEDIYPTEATIFHSLAVYMAEP